MALKSRFAMLTLGSLAMCGGCGPPIEYDPTQDHSNLEATEFIHYLSAEPMVTFDEACRAVLLLVDGEDTAATFEARYEELLSRGVVRAQWNLQAKSAVDRGTLAYMIFKGCKMRGGLNVRLFASSGLGDRRYALREVIRQEVMPQGVPYQVLSGGQVLSAISNADDYLADHGGYPTGEEDAEDRGE